MPNLKYRHPVYVHGKRVDCCYSVEEVDTYLTEIKEENEKKVRDAVTLIEKDRCLDRLDAWDCASKHIMKDIQNIRRINAAQEKLILRLQEALKKGGA